MQSALPGIDMRPICPLCHAASDVLGQFSPRVGVCICKRCTVAQAINTALLMHWDTTSWEQRAAVIEAEARVRAAVTPRYTPPRGLTPLRSWHNRLMAFCHDCGNLHANCSPYNGVAYDRCEVCEARYQVRMTYQARSDNPVFKIKQVSPDDAEAVLDLLYRFHRDWFECGVLPDYWFELSRDDSSVSLV